MRLFLVALFSLSLPACYSQAVQASSVTTTTSEESTTTTSTPQIFTAPPVQTSERLDLPQLDFSVTGEDSVSSNDEVISGVFMIYANIDQITLQSGDIDIVVRETLGKVCKHFNSDAGAPTLTSMFMDARTLGQERLGMNYSFQMLPPVEAGKDCINRLAMVGFGPKEPPYGELAPPPIRALLRREMDAYRPTRFLDMTTWYLSIQNMSCDVRRVYKFWNHSRSEDVFPTETPECLGGESIDWEPNLKGEFKTENVGSCSLAGSDACLCASIPGCEWVPLVAGARKCVWTATPGVACDACIYQEKCVQTPEKVCSSRSMPCTCVLSAGGCAWDLSNNSCYYNPGGATPCIACARQYFCQRPAVFRSEPLTFSVMGSKDISYSWSINVTFDRRMEFHYSGLGSGISLACRVRFPGDSAPTFEFDYSKLAVVDRILYIDTFGISNEFQRDCDLIIQDNALRGASGLLPYGGMQMNEVLITMPDTFPPQCQVFSPPNSARSVPLNAIITFTFSERIAISAEEGDNRTINIIRLGGNISDPQADVTVGNISILDATRVTAVSENLMVRLDGLVDFSQYYSITLPAGVIVDRDRNAFEGLDRARYLFTTMQNGIVSHIIDADEESFNYTWIISVVVGSMIAVVALVLGYAFCIQIQSTSKKANVMAVDSTPKFITTVKEDGTLQQTAPEPQKYVHEDGDDDWSDAVSPNTSMYANTSRQNFYTAKSMTTSPRIAWSPSNAAVTAAEFLQRPDKLQVQVIAKPDDPKFDVRSQLRRSGSVVSLAETRENSLDAFKRMLAVEGGASGSPSPTSARRAPKWTPTHQATSPSVSPKADRRSAMARRSLSSSWSPSARGGSKSARSSLSARGSNGSGRLAWQSPRNGPEPTPPDQGAPALAATTSSPLPPD